MRALAYRAVALLAAMLAPGSTAIAAPPAFSGEKTTWHGFTGLSDEEAIRSIWATGPERE
jgi:hypothetical protein